MVKKQNLPAVIRSGNLARHMMITSNLAFLGVKLYHSELYAALAISMLWGNNEIHWQLEILLPLTKQYWKQ